MRLSEFTLKEENAVSPEFTKAVQDAEQAVEQNPELLTKFKQIALQLKAKAQELLKKKNPQQEAESIEIVEDSQVSQQSEAIANAMQNIMAQLANYGIDPSEINNLEDSVQKELQNLARSERAVGVEQGKVLGKQEAVQEYQNFLKEYSDAIDALNSKIVKSEEAVIEAFQAQEKLNIKEKKTIKQKMATIKNLRNAINQVFVNKIITPKDRENFLINPEKQKQLLDFIKQAATGIIHFESVLEAGADGRVASIRDLIPEEYKDIYNTFARNLYDVRPNTTAGSWGPGEVGLIILGDPVTKASDGGDLTDGTHKFELKASNDPKKGGRLSPKGIATSPITKKFDRIKQDFFFSHLNNKQKKQEPFADLAKTNTIGKTSIPLINHAIDSIEHITGKKFDGIGFMNECIKACFTDNVPTDKELNSYVVPMIGGERIEKVKEGGRMKVIPHPVPRGYDYNKFVRGYAKFLYNRYKGVGQEEEHFKNIIVFNPGQETYTVIDGAEDFDNPKVIVTGGIEFAGSQVPKSPQVGVEGIQEEVA